MANAHQIASAECLVAYLLRGLRHRIGFDRIPAQRRRRIGAEMTDYLIPAAVSARSVEEWVRLVAQRFEVELTGEGYLGEGGREHEARPAYALLPRRFLPQGTQELVHPRATEGTEGVAAVRWDHLCRQIDFAALRLAIDRNPALVVTFALNPPTEGEDALFPPFVSSGSAASWTAALPTRLHTPRGYTTVMTLMSPCSHGADHKSGNVTMFRRQRYKDPVTGDTYWAPFIAGNAWRGVWRDEAGALTCRDVGLKLTEVDPKIAHALMAGGTIEAGADGAGVDLALRRRVRALIPAWDLFAGVLQQQIMRGMLRVHDSHLVCRENAWLLYDRIKPAAGGARLAYEDFRAALEPADNLTQLRLLTRHAHRDLADSEGMQMLTETEVLLPGAQLVHSFQLIAMDGVSTLARSFFTRVLREFQDNAFIGAGNARGLGAVAFDPYAPGDPAHALPSEDEYLAFVAEHRDEIRAFLLGKRGEAITAPDPIEPKATRRARARGKSPAGAPVPPPEGGF